MTSALNQITNAAARWRLWTTFAWEDVKTSYRRSLIGVLWISLSFTIFVAVKVLIFGAILRDSDAGAGHYFGAYIMLGFFVWQFMNQVNQFCTGCLPERGGLDQERSDRTAGFRLPGCNPVAL